jgi:probable HAF family extracellular repeat protein
MGWFRELVQELSHSIARFESRKRSVRRRPIEALALEALEIRDLLSYTVTDLGTLGGRFSEATGINNAGQVTGESRLHDGSLHAFIYSDGNLTDLGTLGGDSSSANGINGVGLVVGGASTTDGDYHAFITDGTDTIDLGTLGGYGSMAAAINDDGWITGYANLDDNITYHAVLWTNDDMFDLGTLGGPNSAATGINAAGQIVGFSDAHGSATPHAFLWDSGQMTDLGSLGGYHSWGRGINDAGQIIGEAQIRPGDFAPYHAFLWDNGAMTDLGTLGGETSWATGINSAGQVVGYSITDLNSTHAYIYSDGAMTDLNNLIPSDCGWTLGEAMAINDSGQIVGAGMIDGLGHAFLLTPDDGPATQVATVPRDISAAPVTASGLKASLPDSLASSKQAAHPIESAPVTDQTGQSPPIEVTSAPMVTAAAPPDQAATFDPLGVAQSI